MDMLIVYLMADDHIQNNKAQLYMKDICQICCRHEKVQHYLESLPVEHEERDSNGRVILSVMDLIGPMMERAKAQYPDMQLHFVNLGSEQVIIERRMPEPEKPLLTWLKVGFASLIVFAGAAFTIMTYDQDVDVTGVFAAIYEMVLGYVPAQPGALEAAYSVGVAAGILMFFNPFTASKKRKEPSPIEIEMEKYESDIQDTILKMNQRGSR